MKLRELQTERTPRLFLEIPWRWLCIFAAQLKTKCALSFDRIFARLGLTFVLAILVPMFSPHSSAHAENCWKLSQKSGRSNRLQILSDEIEAALLQSDNNTDLGLTARPVGLASGHPFGEQVEVHQIGKFWHSIFSFNGVDEQSNPLLPLIVFHPHAGYAVGLELMPDLKRFFGPTAELLNRFIEVANPIIIRLKGSPIRLRFRGQTVFRDANYLHDFTNPDRPVLPMHVFRGPLLNRDHTPFEDALIDHDLASHLTALFQEPNLQMWLAMQFGIMDHSLAPLRQAALKHPDLAKSLLKAKEVQQRRVDRVESFQTYSAYMALRKNSTAGIEYELEQIAELAKKEFSSASWSEEVFHMIPLTFRILHPILSHQIRDSIAKFVIQNSTAQERLLNALQFKDAYFQHILNVHKAADMIADELLAPVTSTPQRERAP